MGISGGGDRSELRPLRPDGNLDHDLPDQIVGNHKGQYGYFNWKNLPPGLVVQWTTDHEFLGCIQRGWRPADPETDGSPCNELMRHYTSETHNPFPGYRPVVTTVENFRRLQEEKARESRAKVSDASLGFLENIGANEHELFRGRGRGSRFATKWHETTVKEGDSTLEHLTPGGILREEDI